MDNEDYWIPRNLDAPPLLFKWEADSAVLFVMMLILFGVLNMYLFGMFAAFLSCRGYSYMKEEGGRGLIMKTLYWYTPSEIMFSNKVPSHIREYIGA